MTIHRAAVDVARTIPFVSLVFFVDDGIVSLVDDCISTNEKREDHKVLPLIPTIPCLHPIGRAVLQA